MDRIFTLGEISEAQPKHQDIYSKLMTSVSLALSNVGRRQTTSSNHIPNKFDMVISSTLDDIGIIWSL
jgi:hypothetical protein